MPRYFFSLSDGTNVLVDFEGRELANAVAARERAAEAASRLLDDGAGSLSPDGAWDIEITDEDGSLVASLPFRRPIETRPPRG